MDPYRLKGQGKHTAPASDDVKDPRAFRGSLKGGGGATPENSIEPFMRIRAQNSSSSSAKTPNSARLP
jgi:hypothetical protein